MAKISLEAGNSPPLVFTDYRELFRPVEAEKWYGMLPGAAEVVQAATARLF